MSDNRQIAEQLCERWFDTGARAAWCPKMVDEFAAALQAKDADHAALLLEARDIIEKFIDHHNGIISFILAQNFLEKTRG